MSYEFRQIINYFILLMKRYKHLLWAFLIGNTGIACAQNGGPPKGGSNFKMPAIGHIYGKIIDAKTKDAVPFVSVAIYKKDSLVGGSLAGNNGEFSLENLSFGTFNLKISFIGFKTFQKVITITPQNSEQDIGNIKLETAETVLKSVEVVTEKSASQINIDRKVYNVDKDLTVKGGTATDVMKNIPSVTLDADGNAQLRQNAVTIYIDGRPTTLTLDQIPADKIDRVEVITNPSAKFEASATGGIINIVMKSNSKPGYNGIITGGIGTNDHYNGMAALNFKQKPIGFSVAYNYNTFNNPITGYSNRTGLLNGNPTGYYNTNSNSSFENKMQFGSATLDYYLNNRNTLSISENMAIGNFNTFTTQSFQTRAVDTVMSYGTRQTPALTHFEHYTTTAHYKKTFPKKGEDLNIDVSYTTANINSPSNYTTNTFGPNGLLMQGNPELQKNLGHTTSQVGTFSADYVDPISDTSKLELGVRSNYKPSVQTLDVSEYNYNSGEYSSDIYLTSHYKIIDLVSAAYINYTSRFKGLNYALGLRFEDSYYKGTITNKSDSSFQYQYPGGFNNIMNALFPSLFIGKKLNEKQEIQCNVSRKISRPGFRQLMPFIMASGPKDYTIGNPDLTPEFITMGELNFNQLLSKGNLFFTLFYRNKQNPLTSYVSPSPVDATILINTTINGKQSNTFGMDNTFKYAFFKRFEATLNMNFFYIFIDASYKNINNSNQGFNYTTKLNLVYHLPKNFNLQLSGSYESPKVIPQGTAKELYFADCGLSKEIRKFIVLTASVSDIFNSKGQGLSYVTDQYLLDTWNRRESRYVKLTAMIRFGRVDASVFKKRQPSQQQEDSDF